jgi:hypothetical protein
VEITNLIDEFYKTLTGTNNPLNAGINKDKITRGTTSLDYKVAGVEFRMQFLDSSNYILTMHIQESNGNPSKESDPRHCTIPYSKGNPNTSSVIEQNLELAKVFTSQ